MKKFINVEKMFEKDNLNQMFEPQTSSLISQVQQ